MFKFAMQVTELLLHNFNFVPWITRRKRAVSCFSYTLHMYVPACPELFIMTIPGFALNGRYMDEYTINLSFLSTCSCVLGPFSLKGLDTGIN